MVQNTSVFRFFYLLNFRAIIAWLTDEPGVPGSILGPSHTTFVELIMKSFYTAISPLPLIQEGQLLVTGESMDP